MIIARAQAGDLAALIDSDAQLYGEVLERLLEWSRGDDSGASDERLTRIISFILANGALRANGELAGLVCERWLSAPSAQALPQMLRMAALSDDAGSFERSIDAAMQSWRQGQLAPMTPGELRTLIEAEYWVLSDAARRSGRGNVLKQTLARVHRDLAVRRESN